MDNIIEVYHLNEGGNAIRGAQAIRGDLALPVANELIGILKQKWPSNNFAPLGSTGKKDKSQTSGDIDIATDIPIEQAGEIEKYLTSYPSIKERGGMQTNFLKGLKILSVGYPWATRGKGDDCCGIVQCDLMFVPDVPRAQYFYWSPDFTKKESQFKGSIRNIFMTAIMKHIPVQGKQNTTFTSGHVKDLWKYTIKPQEGIVLLHQSYEGKKGQELKSKHTVKEDTEVILEDPKKFTKFILGPKAEEKDMVSFENQWEYFWSDKFPWPDQREYIVHDFVEDMTNENTRNPELVEKVLDYMRGSNHIPSMAFALKTGIV
jgi:hypothetical protein